MEIACFHLLLMCSLHTILNICPDCYKLLNIIHSDDLQNMSRTLRTLMVHELKAHCDEYQGFVSGSNLVEEADKFLDKGYFFGEGGKCMPLALSNAPGMPMFILCTLISQPLNPRKVTVFFPIFNHHRCGHYDALGYGANISLKFQEANRSGTRMCGCTCGCGDKGYSKTIKAHSDHTMPLSKGQNALHKPVLVQVLPQ